MAISRGNASQEVKEFKKYIGVCPVFVKAVNPDKKEYEKLFNTTLEEAPVYVQDKEDFEGKSYKNVRLNIILKPDVEKIGLDIPIIPFSLFITNQKQYSNKGKYHVVDKYGRFAWATEDEIKNKKVPVFANGNKADIDMNDVRVAYVGEQEFTEFLQAFLFIPTVTVWDKNTQTRVPNPKATPDQCECRFDLEDFEKMFKGDFTNIKEIFNYQPTNKLKVGLGVKTDVNSGRMYQVVYTKKFMANSTTNYSSLDKKIQEDIKYAQDNNKALNTEYSAKPVHEYVVTPTVFTANTNTDTASEELPFDVNSTDESSPW